MIEDKQMGWLKEFLRRICESPEDQIEAEDIVDTFRKLWVVAKASEQNPYPRSPRLMEALAALKPIKERGP